MPVPGRESPRVPRQLSWTPSWLTVLALGLALLYPAWLLNPLRANEIGADAKNIYAAASLATTGGNPYDAARQTAEEDRLYNQPRQLHLGDPGAYSATPYAYPPVVTSLVNPLVRLGPLVFLVLMLAAIPLAALAALEIVMNLLGWRQRGIVRAFLLASAPLAQCEFVGNPSALLLLFWALGLWLFARGRPLIAGAVLSLTLWKLPVGLPAAVAVLALAPSFEAAGRSRLRAAAGLLLGTLIWVGVGELAGHPGVTMEWIQALGLFGGALSRTGGQTPVILFDLAGLPALLPLGLPVAAGVGASAALAYGISAAVLPWGHGHEGSRDAYLGVGLLVAAGLLSGPYVHPNDLVLEVLPVLVIASHPLTPLTRLTLAVWAVGSAINVLLAIVLALALHVQRPLTRAGFGVFLTTLVFAALARIAARQRAAPIESRP